MANETKENVTAWPVIVHKTLTNPEVLSSLKQRNFVIRGSESVVPGSVIFPLSGGVAFLTITLDKVTHADLTSQKPVLTSELTERLDNFVKVHRHCYLLCKAPIHGDTERQIFSMIQKQYLSTRLQMLPVHNTQESVTAMVTIAKALCRPNSELLFSRLTKVVEDTQQKDFRPQALKSIDLNGLEIQTILENYGDLAAIATVSEEELIKCGLDSRSANKIVSFFSK